MMTSKQAADYLGYSVKYLYKLVHYGIIPYSKPNGGKLMFDEDKLKDWVNNGSNYSDRISEAATYITAKK